MEQWTKMGLCLHGKKVFLLLLILKKCFCKFQIFYDNYNDIPIYVLLHNKPSQHLLVQSQQ